MIELPIYVGAAVALLAAVAIGARQDKRRRLEARPSTRPPSTISAIASTPPDKQEGTTRMEPLMTSTSLRILAEQVPYPNTLLLRAADAMAALERENARMREALDRLVADNRAEAEEAAQQLARYALERFAGEIEGKIVPLRAKPVDGRRLWDEPA